MDKTRKGLGMAHKTKTQTTHINPLFNAAFVRLFGREESADYTVDFADSILARVGVAPLGEVKSISGEHTGLSGSVDAKFSRMDVLLISPDDRHVDLESEIWDPDFDNRFLFYSAKEMVAATKAGEDYNSLSQVIVVVLYDAKIAFPESREFVSTCSLRWKCGDDEYPGSDKQLFVLVELQKFRKQYPVLDERVLADKMLSWLYILTSAADFREHAS